MRNVTTLLSLFLLLGIGAVFGVAFQKYQFFPYSELQEIYTNNIKGKKLYGPWSIGLYQGSTPFELKPISEVNNPILTGADVTDIDAKFVADPFYIQHNDSFFMFFEVLNKENNQGDIGYAESKNGIDWEYKKIVIDEDFHLSYPYVFEWNDEFYLIPESHEDLSVRLYKAKDFPSSWEYVGNILSGYPFIDPSIIHYQNRWWLFVASKGNETLNIFYSDSLDGEWRPHKKNPIIKFDANFARPGGRFIQYNDSLYRVCQDDYPAYGLQVYAFEINAISPDVYKETIVSDIPLLTGSGEGWNKTGMHHLDVQNIDGRWHAIVDGHSR